MLMLVCLFELSFLIISQTLWFFLLSRPTNIVKMKHLSAVIQVTLTTITILWLTSATSSSSTTSSRHLFMTSSAENSITASKLYDVTAVSLIVCQSACLADDACLITVFNTQSQTCSLFTAGTTVYNITAGLKVNFIDSKIVSYTRGVSCVSQGQCATSAPPAPSPYCCLCQNENTGSVTLTCQHYTVSFEATSSTSLSAPSVPGIVSFNNMMVDHWSFNKQNNSFTAPVTGYYWLHVSIAIPDATMANVQLISANRTISIIRNFIVFTGGPDVSSTSDVMYLARGSNVYVSSQYPMYSDNSLQTAFGGFCIDSIMSPVVAFSLFLPSFPNPGAYVNVPYSITYIDTHQGWNTTTNEYVVPVAGVYVFSISIAVPQGSVSSLSFNVNGNVKLFHLYSRDMSHTGSDAQTGLIMFSVKVKDRVAENTDRAGNLMGFSGFLYSPTMMPSVAFCVAYAGYLLNVVDPVFYDSVIVNVGSGWNAAASKFFTPQSGIYYVHIIGMTRPYNSSVLDILVNGQPRFNSFIQSVTHNNVYQNSRGSILRLQLHDEMHVRLTSGQVTSSVNRHMTFSGFLIQLV